MHSLEVIEEHRTPVAGSPFLEHRFRHRQDNTLRLTGDGDVWKWIDISTRLSTMTDIEAALPEISEALDLVNHAGLHVWEHIFFMPSTFSTTLNRLRKLIGNKEAIQLQDGKLTIDQKYCWMDTWAF